MGDTTVTDDTDLSLNVEKVSHKVAIKVDEEVHILRDKVQSL